MNASRLREVIDSLLKLENQFQIQQTLNELSQHLDNMVGQPQQPQFQNQFSDTFKSLQTACESLRQNFDPAQIDFLNEIGASSFFVEDIAAQINDWMQKNPLTPVVIQTNLNNYREKRQSYIDNITKLRDSLDVVGVKASFLQEGDAEIGFLLPRSLFDNNFDQLIKELSEIRFVLRAFSELATGGVEPVEVREISTSDPLFFLAMMPVTIEMIGDAVTWALDTWKKLEEIRKVRAETSKLKEFSQQEIESFFETKIRKTVDTAISEKLASLLPLDDPEKKGRAKEQREHLKRSLDWLLERIERGVTIQIRFLPPPATAQEEGQPPDIPKEFKALKEIAPKLVFPQIEGTPILQLTQENKD